LAILVNPSLVEEKRSPLRDVAVVVVDESPSQQIGDRAAATEAALAALTERLGRERDLDVRVIRSGKPQPGAGDDGTRLFTALSRSMSDIPRQRLAGVVMLTDGQVHDVPPGDAAAAAQGARRAAPCAVVRAAGRGRSPPRRRAGAELRPGRQGIAAEHPGRRTCRRRPRIRRASPKARRASPGARMAARRKSVMVPIGRDVPVSIPIDHGGPNVLELEVEPGPQELTLANNRAASSSTACATGCGCCSCRASRMPANGCGATS